MFDHSPAEILNKITLLNNGLIDGDNYAALNIRTIKHKPSVSIRTTRNSKCHYVIGRVIRRTGALENCPRCSGRIGENRRYTILREIGVSCRIGHAVLNSNSITGRNKNTVANL